MLTIDLLKGTGVPIRNNPGTLALKALPFVLPLVLAVYLVGNFRFNQTILAMEAAGVTKMQDKLAEHSADIQRVRQWNSAAEQTQKNLAEVTRGLGRHVQWSQTIEALVAELPESVGLKELKLSRNTSRKKTTDPNSKKQITKTLIHRILTLQVFGSPSWEADEAVHQYLKRLQQASPIRQRVKDIRIVSQQSDELNGKPVTIHTIECEFQPQE